jgi:hypothetical protein
MKGMILKRMGLLLLVGILGACAQSRSSLYAGQRTEELWEPVSLCSVNVSDHDPMGCFSVQLSITRNLAYFDVQELLFNPGSVPYRILARRANESQFTVLVDHVTTPVGGTIEVHAKKGAYIEEYEEFRVELTKGKDASGLNLIDVQAGMGLPVAQDVLSYTELNDLNY